MDIFLVRHGQMHHEDNQELNFEHVYDYFTGVKEGPLTQKGLLQAKCVAGYFEKLDIQAIYSSNFIRAKQTAHETALTSGRPVKIIQNLGEINTGRLAPEIHRLQFIDLKFIRLLNKILPFITGKKLSKGFINYLLIILIFKNWYDGKTIQGETYDKALLRIKQAFKHIIETNPHKKRIAVFTHGYFIHLLVNHIIDPDRGFLRIIKKPYIQNGSITHLTQNADTFGPGVMIRKYAATEHLKLNI
jgi:broad specificity phosphatase PhoE